MSAAADVRSVNRLSAGFLGFGRGFVRFGVFGRFMGFLGRLRAFLRVFASRSSRFTLSHAAQNSANRTSSGICSNNSISPPLQKKDAPKNMSAPKNYNFVVFVVV